MVHVLHFPCHDLSKPGILCHSTLHLTKMDRRLVLSFSHRAHCLRMCRTTSVASVASKTRAGIRKSLLPHVSEDILNIGLKQQRHENVMTTLNHVCMQDRYLQKVFCSYHKTSQKEIRAKLNLHPTFDENGTCVSSILNFGVSTLQKKALSNQNRGHLGSRHTLCTIIVQSSHEEIVIERLPSLHVQ